MAFTVNNKPPLKKSPKSLYTFQKKSHLGQVHLFPLLMHIYTFALTRKNVYTGPEMGVNPIKYSYLKDLKLTVQ